MILRLGVACAYLLAVAGCGDDACSADCAVGAACSTGDTCASFYCSKAGKCAPLDCDEFTGAAPDAGVAPSYAAIDANILARSCATFSVCHGAKYKAGKMDLETDAYAALVGVTPTNKVAAAMNMKRVDPGNEANSFLVMKLTMPAYSADYGDVMPGGQRLDATSIDTLRCWIRDGAPKN